MIPAKSLLMIDQENVILLKGLNEAVEHALVQIRRSHCQLTQIEFNHEDRTIRQNAIKFLNKNEKLQEIATDLMEKMARFNTGFVNEAQPSTTVATIQQFILEVELLHDMHFAVAKTYVGFIHRLYKTRIIPLQAMAA